MKNKKDTIFIVDDDRSLSEIMKNMLEFEGYRCDIAGNGQTALKKFETFEYDLVLLDLKLPDMTGLDVLEKIRKTKSHQQVIMISGEGTVTTAMEAARLGIFDFLEKPLENDRMLLTIQNALEQGRLKAEKIHLLESMKANYLMIGESPQMEDVRSLISKAAMTDSKVLITGENGTGKELVARAIHFEGPGAARPFVTVNCAAIPESLIESELFGHKKGAFTGAVADKPGHFQMADTGTIFLDEIGDMSLLTQAKVLRILEANQLEIVGSNKPVQIDVRVISATNKNLPVRIREKRFREDLYFRINVLTIAVPPLRERRGDIPLLVRHFCSRYCKEHGGPCKQFTEAALKVLQDHGWPGNIRELKNIVEKLIVLSDEVEIAAAAAKAAISGDGMIKEGEYIYLTLNQAKKAFERKFILGKLASSDGNMSEVARSLGISRTYLYKKIKMYGLGEGEERGENELE